MKLWEVGLCGFPTRVAELCRRRGRDWGWSSTHHLFAVVAAISLNSQTFLGHNRAVYQELRTALQLHLRRQLLLAICDDGALQQRLAQQLVVDLTPEMATFQASTRGEPSPLVTLRLDADHPDLVKEVLLWLKQQPRQADQGRRVPAFQILGIETLARQSPTVQKRFLASLLRVDALLTQLDGRLLVWLPRPWLGKIQQMVPGFWQLRNGLYEFESEPTSAVVEFPSVPLIASQTPESRPSLTAPASGVDTEATATVSSAATTPPMEEGLVLPMALARQESIRQRWQYLHRLHQQQAGPLTLARAHLALGQICRGEIGPGAEGLPVLMFALEVYQRAIQDLVAGDKDWCDALNDLASLYWLRAQRETQPEAIEPWLQRSVAAYQRALEGAAGDREQISLDTLGRLYSNLGKVYTQLADLTDPQAYLEQAVEAHSQALRYVAADPLDYANGQNSLGTLHWRLSQLVRPQYHLHRAIVAYQEALRYRLPQAEPQEYAMLQNNLGIAYWSLARHEHPIPWLEQAVDAYQTALVYRTLATTPAGCAITHNNLGTAYWDLAQQQTRQPEERLLSLRQAAEAYEAALDAVEHLLQQSPSETPGFDVWATCHSAGIVHDQLALAQPADRAHHLSAALNHYLLAYQGWQDQPEQLDILATALVYSVRLHFEMLGLAGQQSILSKLPPDLLGRVLPQL